MRHVADNAPAGRDQATNFSAREQSATVPGVSSGSSADSSLPQTAPAGLTAGGRLFGKAEFADLAREILRNGGSWQDVADAAGCSIDAARVRGNRLGIYRSNAKPSAWPKQRVMLAARLAAKHGTKQAAAVLGIEDSALRMALSRAGISVVRLRAKARRAAEIA